MTSCVLFAELLSPRRDVCLNRDAPSPGVSFSHDNGRRFAGRCLCDRPSSTDEQLQWFLVAFVLRPLLKLHWFLRKILEALVDMKINNRDSSEDRGMDRRDFIKRMAWAGTGLAFSMSGGVARPLPISALKSTAQSYPAGVPWVTMRGNRQNTGVSPLVGFKYTENSNPALAWVSTNPQGLSLINATPIIGAGDVVYIGSSNNYLYSFDPKKTKGQQLVPKLLGNIVDSAGCFLTPDHLFFPCGDFSLWEVMNGDVTSAVPHKMSTDGGSPSTIHWFEGNVVADVNGRIYAGNDDFFLYCCDPATGKYPVWLFPAGFFIWTACSFSPDNTTLYFASADMTVYALDISQNTPVEKWEFEVGNMCTSSVAVDSQNIVYFGSFDGLIYAVNGSTGEKLWSHNTKSLIYASPAISEADGVLYIISSDGVMRAVATQNNGQGKQPGTVIWEFFTGMPSFSSAVLGPDPAPNAPAGAYLIYVGTGQGEVLALQPNGRRRWSFDIATLYSQGSDPADPAFWSSFRYPQINSSLAIGESGVATATSGGLILSIDYYYYNTKAAGINTTATDDYLNQLPDQGTRFCYISGSGRMMETVLDPNGSTILMLYPAESINLTALKKYTVTNTAQTRSTFTMFPADAEANSGGKTLGSRLSADLTQLYIDPIDPLPAAGSSATIQVISKTQGSLVEFVVQYREVTSPLSATDLPDQNLELLQASFFSPFIVPALDQLGLATITLPFRVVDILDDTTGALWAYGYENYTAKDAGGAGVTRNLLYIFNGNYLNGNLVLNSLPSFFELTSFPTPLTTMKMSGAVGTGGSTGLSLQVEYATTVDSLIDWVCQLLTHWLGEQIPYVGDVCAVLQESGLGSEAIESLKQKVKAAKADFSGVEFRIFLFLLRVALNFQSILSDWKLFNGGQFTWAGTYSLGNGTKNAPPAVKNVTFHNTTVPPILKVTVEFTAVIPSNILDELVIGIVILQSDGTPLKLNYTNVNQPPVITNSSSATTIEQSIDLAGVTLTGCKAVVFLNLEMLPKEYTF
jgi:outer membrane protein assembly factor BamB